MIKAKPSVEVNALVQHNDLEIIKVHNEKWRSNKILHSGVQKPGLALAGYVKYLDKRQIQVFGKTEIGYLKQLPKDGFEKGLKDFMSIRVPGIIVSENQELEESVITFAAKYKTPVLVSNLRSSLLIPRLNNYLFSHFSEKIRVHGVYMDIQGLGVLLTGVSSVGKSETALELINKGHHFISDDLVEFYLNSNDEPVGRTVDRIKKWLEVRGLGIINIVDIFGVGALLNEKKLDLVIHLEKWDPKKKYDRLGEGNLYYNVLGKDIPMFNLPVAVGRNLATLIEVAVKYFISRKNGSLSFIEHMYKDEQIRDEQQ
ncbi:MAG: HPr(Ser) kinase/phosphatase [bacterium]|nr:HPr(Ser) kinase/phosphatase [bacterium]